MIKGTTACQWQLANSKIITQAGDNLSVCLTCKLTVGWICCVRNWSTQLIPIYYVHALTHSPVNNLTSPSKPFNRTMGGGRGTGESATGNQNILLLSPGRLTWDGWRLGYQWGTQHACTCCFHWRFHVKWEWEQSPERNWWGPHFATVTPLSHWPLTWFCLHDKYSWLKVSNFVIYVYDFLHVYMGYVQIKHHACGFLIYMLICMDNGLYCY